MLAGCLLNHTYSVRVSYTCGCQQTRALIKTLEMGIGAMVVDMDVSPRNKALDFPKLKEFDLVYVRATCLEYDACLIGCRDCASDHNGDSLSRGPFAPYLRIETLRLQAFLSHRG